MTGDSTRRSATAFAPASVGNVGVGFDILGHTVAALGDKVRATRRAEPGVAIRSITGAVENLPLAADKNTAGMAVLAGKGYHAARVDDVVTEAGVSHGTFYLYFANKEALVLALAERCAADLGGLVARLGDISAEPAGRKAVRGGTTRSSVVLGGHLFALRHLSDSIDTQQRQLAEIDAYSGACTHVSRRQLGPL